jgi:hypothetical protein
MNQINCGGIDVTFFDDNQPTFDLLAESIQKQLLELLENNHLDEHNLNLKKKYRGGSSWKRGEKATEGLFKSAIVQGIDKCHTKKGHPVQKIWCSNAKKEHESIKRINLINTEYKPKSWDLRLAKSPDLAWQTDNGNKPNWFCQVKVLTIGEGTNHKKSIQALGDLFWGVVDKTYLRSFFKHNAEFIFVWIEDKKAVNSKTKKPKNDVGRFLKFDNNIGQMSFILSPGYHKDVPGTPPGGYGELRYKELNERNPETGEVWPDSGPWVNKSKAIVMPNNRTAIKEILAAGTNGTFFRMFNQPGKLFIRTKYKQFESENWHIYIHRLTPNSTLTKADVSKSEHGGGKLFNWIP